MIKINNLEFQELACLYTDSTLQLKFNIKDITLQELESYFSFNTDAIIEQYADDILINKWYYKEFQSISYEKTETGWNINLFLDASTISNDDLTDIRNLIQEKEDAILEIASLIDTSDTQTNMIKKSIENVNKKIEDTIKQIEELKTLLLTRINEVQQLAYHLNNGQVNLTNRVSHLEANQGGR